MGRLISDWKRPHTVAYTDHSKLGAMGAMRGLTKNLRKRAAIAIAVAYAFCVLAPAGALAAVSNPTVFHCIGEMSAKASSAAQHGAAHTHDDGGEHHHGQVDHDQSGAADHHSGAGGNPHDGTCCGLFCVAAIAHDPGLTFGVATPASPSVVAAANGLTGRAPGPLHRPPIA